MFLTDIFIHKQGSNKISNNVSNIQVLKKIERYFSKNKFPKTFKKAKFVF